MEGKTIVKIFQDSEQWDHSIPWWKNSMALIQNSIVAKYEFPFDCDEMRSSDIDKVLSRHPGCFAIY